MKILKMNTKKMIEDFVDLIKPPPTQAEIDAFSKKLSTAITFHVVIRIMLWTFIYPLIITTVAYLIVSSFSTIPSGSELKGFVSSLLVLMVLSLVVVVALYDHVFSPVKDLDSERHKLCTQSRTFDKVKLGEAIMKNPDIKSYVQQVNAMGRGPTHAEIKAILDLAEERESAKWLTRITHA